MTELKNELENGARRQLYLAGKAKIVEDSFGSKQVSKSGYVYRRAGFAVKVGETRSIYVTLMGGYSQGNPVIYAQNKDNEQMQINWKQRNNPEILKQVADYSFINMAIEKDEDGNLIQKKFLSEYDAIEYMSEHLEDGANVLINATANYSLYNDDTQRDFNITSISLDLGYTDSKTGEKHEARTPAARLTQTYLITSESLSDDYEQELAEEEKTTINAWVPQYLSKLNGESIKRVVALPQKFTVRVKEGNVDKAKLLLDRFIIPEDSDIVREITLRMDILDGYSTSQGKIDLEDLDDEVREMLEMGLTSEEDLNKQLFVSGDRISETTFKEIILDRDTKRIMKADKYTLSVLSMPIVDDDEEEVVGEEEKIFKDATTEEVEDLEDVFNF